jgi:hypothetical protein
MIKASSRLASRDGLKDGQHVETDGETAHKRWGRRGPSGMARRSGYASAIENPGVDDQWY